MLRLPRCSLPGASASRPLLISRRRIPVIERRLYSSHHHVGSHAPHPPHPKPLHPSHSSPPHTLAPPPSSIAPSHQTPASLPPPGAAPFATPPTPPRIDTGAAVPPPPPPPPPPIYPPSPSSQQGGAGEPPHPKRMGKRLIPALLAAIKLLARKILVIVIILTAAILIYIINPLLEGDTWKHAQEKTHEDGWRQSAAEALQELLVLPPCRLIFVSAPHNAGKSSFILSIVSKFDAVAYLNLSKYGSLNTIDDLVQLLTEQFNIWSGPKVGKDIRNVVELIGLPRETAEPRVFNRRELSSLLSTIEGILDFYIASHPNAPVPIFFADDAQALSGLLFAGHFQAKESDSGRERRDAHEALRDFFAWAAAMSKAGKCHFIASTPSFFFQALASGAIFDDYIIPIELPELARDDAVHYLVEHGVKREKALQLINKSGALLGTLDALSVLTNTGLGRLGFSNARFFELVDSAFEPESIQYRPDPQFAEEMRPRWTPGQWLTVLEELTGSADGAVSMVRLLNKEGMTREGLRSLIEHNLVMYRVSLQTRRSERGPFITASHSGLLNAMKEYTHSYLPAKDVLRIALCEEQSKQHHPLSSTASSTPSLQPSSASVAHGPCKQVSVHAPLSIEDVARQVGATTLSHDGKLLSRNSHLVPLRNGDVVYYRRPTPFTTENDAGSG